ncbi:hypothetical protein JRO89_XS01G0317100 [Xanthoceras sorbifolium]|uniref:Uncharacterized protein n=1 Tax=Xanthoceras sorbifolium TaxID=99658 RepID=A0ABQ8IML2_9ROSI|nr:hypothetical protein JRO89_XS01G0317100 [Xanthoceras sorbifolium]
MVDVTFPGADFLKQTLSWLRNVAGPSNTATVKFHRDGISLLASPPDRSVITLVRIKSESFRLFHVDNDYSWSCDVNLNRLRVFLNLAGDKDSVGIYAAHFTTPPFWVKLTFKKPVRIHITNSKVTFTVGIKKTVLSREENEYTIERVVPEDDSPSVVVFSLKHLRSLKDLIRRSNSVWIYPPYVGSSPAGLSFSIDPIGINAKLRRELPPHPLPLEVSGLVRCMLIIVIVTIILNLNFENCEVNFCNLVLFVHAPVKRMLLHLDSDKKDSSKNVLSMKRLSFSISPLTNKNDIFSSKTMKMPSKEDLKSSTERNVPGHLVEVPLNYKTRSNQRISWGVLPPAIQDLGKEAVCHRNVALLAAILALEEASALEAVIYCLQAFSELCNSSQKVSAGPLAEQFLDVHQSMQKAVVVINSLINRNIPEAKSSTRGSLQSLSPDVYNTLTSKNAASWVHAAIETDLSKFSLFRKPENNETVNGEKYHYLLPSIKKMNTERKEGYKGSKLKEAASLAEKLLLVSHQWFLKYIEDSLNLRFGLSRDGSSEIAGLLRQLKRVNEWLDELARVRVEADDRIQDLRKKLYGF